MSKSIENEVVQLDFDNNRFERGVATTLSTLGKLKSMLKLDGASKGLENVDAAAKKISLDKVASGVETIASKFSTLGVIGITALANIATKAIQVGSQLAKSLTIDPIKQGFEEYQTNLNSVQTILANTQASGAKLSDVNRTLQELNTYSDKTIYNFSQMAKNIGTFTAAGVDLKTSAASIKGIANLAALSGSNSEQASNAMYQLSQAIASGKVSLMDWNSVVNAGMGGTTFQRALAQTAVKMGKLDESSLKLSGSMKNVTVNGMSFRDSISSAKGDTWLTSDVLTSTLQQFTGDLTDAQLAAQGFNAEQIKAIQQTAKTAQAAATEVKTLTGLMDTTKEAVGSGWAQTFQLIFGNFEEAKKNFTGLSKVIGGFVSANADARNKVLGDWRDLGGQKALWDTIHAAIEAVVSVVTPIKEAFRDIFPATTGKQLADLTKGLLTFVKGLKISSETASKLRHVFQGVFAFFDIARIIIVRIAKVIGDVLGTAFDGAGGGILDFAAKMGDWIVSLRYAVKYGEGFESFLKNLTNVLKVPIEGIKQLARIFMSLFQGDLDTSTMSDALGRLQDRLEPFKALGETIVKIWSNVKERLGDVFAFMQPFAQMVGDAFGRLGEAIQDSIKTGDFSGILDAINTGLFGGLVLIFKKFLSNGVSVDLGGGFLEKIGDSFDALTGSLQAMQQNIKADTLLKIAGAVGILTVSVVALSLIDSAALTKSLGAITVMFIQLGAALAVFDKISTGPGVLKLPILAAGLGLLAIAIGLLAISVAALSKLSWQELIKGLTGVVVLLGALAGTTQLMAKNAPKMITAGIGLAAIAVAVKILASAVKDFSGMGWGEMAKGLAGVGAALTSLAIFTRLAQVNKMGIANGVGLIMLGVALKVIASAVKDFGGMDWVTLGKGFGSMAVSLGLIAAAMALLPPTMAAQSAGLVLVAGALVIMAGALKMMGGMSWEEIAKGLVTLAGGLVVIAAALNLMSGTLAGSAALLVAAAALAVLTPVLMALGSMSWEEIGKGLLTLAGIFTVLGLAGLALGPVVPILLGLGIAVALIGVGLAAAGAGVLLFATGLTALSAAGAGAAVAITTIVSAIIGLIPMAMKALAEGIVLFAKVIGDAAPTFLVAMTKLISALLQAISNLAPKIINTMLNLVLTLLRTIGNKLPQFINAGVKIITGFLDGIARNIPKVVASALKVMTTFIRELGKAVPKLVEAGMKAIVDLVNGISRAIDNNSTAMGEAGGRLAVSIIRGMVNGIRAGAGQVWEAAKSMASNALDSVKSFLGIASPSKEFHKLGGWTVKGFANGLDDLAPVAGRSAAAVGHAAIDSMRKSISGLGDIVSQEVNMRPRITPILDLSEVQSNSGKINSIFDTPKVRVAASYEAASAIPVRAHNTTGDDVASPGATPNLMFIQNNNSPKALSSADLYRQTRNQISSAKGALKVYAS